MNEPPYLSRFSKVVDENPIQCFSMPLLNFMLFIYIYITLHCILRTEKNLIVFPLMT